MKTGIDLITEERKEQIEKHGWDHDDEYVSGQLLSASKYCLTLSISDYPDDWGDWFSEKVMKKKKRMSCFAFDIEMKKIAGAFIVAEIDRLKNMVKSIADDIDRAQISEMNSIE